MDSVHCGQWTLSTLLSAIIHRLISGSGKGRKDDEREELDFQFDEEVVTPKAKRWDARLNFNTWNWDFFPLISVIMQKYHFSPQHCTPPLLGARR